MPKTTTLSEHKLFQNDIFSAAEKLIADGKSKGILGKEKYGKIMVFIDKEPPKEVLSGPLHNDDVNSPLYGRKIYIGE